MNRPFYQWLLVAIALANTAVTTALGTEIAKPELLVDQPSLTRLLLDGSHEVVVLDVRSAQDYEAGAIPTARRINIGAWKAAFGDGSDAEAWSERIGGVGIGPKTTVVVYDSQTSPSATRLWWLLKYWGVDDVRILDGGYGAWTPPGPAKALAPQPPTNFVAKAQPERLADRAKVIGAIAGDSAERTCLVDTRTAAEVAAGAIPTAQHSDWARYVDPQTGKLRPADELKKLLDAAGYDADRPAITYCRTGGRASLVAFVMELVSGKPATNYWGSYTDWSRRDR